MTAKPWVVVAVMAMMCLMPYQSMDLNYLDEEVESKEGPGQGQGPADILLMGNSYVASNSLHNLIDGVMSAASTPANLSTLNGGGMLLSQHASNVATSGHQWNTTLNNGVWDWVVLQDQSQVPGLPRTDTYWINSNDGAVELAEVIEDNGGETILMMTWGRRAGDGANPWHGYNQRFSNFSNMQEELASGYLDYRDNITANGDTAWVAPVGLAFEHIHDKIVAEGGTPTDSGNTFYDLYSGDGSHPSLSGSYLAASVIYATITGNDPVGLSHSTSLSNGLVLELQQAAAATVFNETSHLDYPWQTNSGGGGNQTPPIFIPANQTLAWDMAVSFGSSLGDDYVMDMQVSQNGNMFILGLYDGDISLGGSCNAYNNVTTGGVERALPFVGKFSSDGTCLWIASADATDTYKYTRTFEIQDHFGKLVVDSNENIYIVSHMRGITSTANMDFGQHSFTPSNQINTEGFIAKLSTNGTWEWVNSLGHSNCPCGIDIDSNNKLWVGHTSAALGDAKISSYNVNDGQLISSYTLDGHSGSYETVITEITDDGNGSLYFAGFFETSVNLQINGSTVYHSSTGANRDFFIGKMVNGVVDWFVVPQDSTGVSHIWDIAIHNENEIYVVGDFYSNLQIGSANLSTGGISNGFIAKINSTGNWQWAIQLDCTCTVMSRAITTDSSGNLFVVGSSQPGQIMFGNSVTIFPTGSNLNIFVAKFANSGIAQWSRSAASNGDDLGKSIGIDSQGRLYVAGSFEATPIFGQYQIASVGMRDIFIARMASDYDGDEIADLDDIDDDGDLIHDPVDSCHYSPIGFRSTGSSDHDSDGCHDELEDDDDDNDLLNDSLDNCPKGMVGWLRTNSSDVDNDGCMDALEDYDDDNDGFDDYEDYCPRTFGNSTKIFEKGCPDLDGDGRPDILDPFEDDPTEWEDSDGDGAGDNEDDKFPNDASQQADTDGDGYGDNPYGNNGDACRDTPGTSSRDRRGCPDSDGDGWSDEGDDFPDDASEYLDTDGDGVPDHIDDFPFDPTQQTDSDGDGYGDNANGNLGDAYPNDASRSADSDRDGIDDQADAFPYDPTQTEDSDGDGMGDNPMGIGADKFSNDSTQWADIDGDGYGDNPNGTNPDAFITDATQWSDADGDGYGDNPAGRLYDLFPDNPTQWIDDDEDGLGDNQSGIDPDPYLNDFDNDGFNDTIDILPRLASPGDLDADGCLDVDDAFDDNPLECLDSDGDGVGDNADADDDNDGWTDADEGREGTDPLDPNETPVDSFEIVIPGTEIGLGAWDLIGVFGGIPVFSWILFGFVTRNKRCARYEEQLEEAQSRDELEQVALSWEYSLMLRMLGPHQGIRLERIRSELDDKFENAELLMAAEEFEPMTEVDQTPIVEAQEKDIPEIGSGPSINAEADQIDENGYSWLMHEGKQWYRTNSESHWFEFEG